MSGKKCSTTTATPARVRLFQPSQRPVVVMREEWIATAWGRVRVSGRLGQRHADAYEAIRWCAEESRERDGQRELLVDPAKVRRTLSAAGYSHQQLWRLLDELMQAVVEIDAASLRGMGHLIDSVKESKRARRDPLTEEYRPLWVVRLGLAARVLDDHDVPVRYNPAPLARLCHGISQAIARHCLTHKFEPAGGWILDNLIETVAGGAREQIRDRRREVRADVEGLAQLGLVIDGDRVRRVEHPPGSVEHPPGSVEHPPGSVEHPPDI